MRLIFSMWRRCHCNYIRFLLSLPWIAFHSVLGYTTRRCIQKRIGSDKYFATGESEMKFSEMEEEYYLCKLATKKDNEKIEIKS